MTLTWDDPSDPGIQRWDYRIKEGTGDFSSWDDLVWEAAAPVLPASKCYATRSQLISSRPHIGVDNDTSYMFEGEGITVERLTNGSEYTIEVRAVAGAGEANARCNRYGVICYLYPV